MNGVLERKEEYLRNGLTFSADQLEMKLDLSQPRTIAVQGINERTGEKRNYLLRVTAQGKLILQ